MLFRNKVRLVGAAILAVGAFFYLSTLMLSASVTKTCNGHGTPNRFGQCVCDPLFSGNDCLDNHIPGYIAELGIGCSLNGLASPFLKRPDIPASCAETQPSLLSGFQRWGPGWASPGCTAYVTTVRAEMARGDFRRARGVPTCMCFPGYGGAACDKKTSPVSADFQICNNHGNRTVGLVRNNTVTGNGAQCTRYLSLQFFLDTLDAENLQLIQEKYLAEFATGFCGTPYLPDNGTLVVSQASDDMRCYCDDYTKGVVCGLGRCPAINGVPCTDNGNPELGYGLVKLSPTKPRTDCVVNCAPGKQWCPSLGRCGDSSCRRDICPSTSPYRCSSGDCVSLRTGFCEDGYEVGVWDNLGNFPRAVDCSVDQIRAVRLPLERLARIQACFGEWTDTPVEAGGFVPAGNLLHLPPGRVYSVEIWALTNFTVNFTLDGTLYALSGKGSIWLDLTRSETQVYEDKYVSLVSLPPLELERVSPSTVQIVPDVALYVSGLGRFRVVSSGGSKIEATYLVSEAYYDSTGEMFVAWNSEGLAIGYDGLSVSNDTSCLDGGNCLWVVSTQANPAGTAFLCLGEHLYVSPFACTGGSFDLDSIEYSKVKTWATALVRDEGTTEWDADETWTLQTPSPSSAYVPQVTLTSSAPLQRIQFLLESDVRVPCICPPPIQFNTTILDEENLLQTYRADAAPGDRVVARRVVEGIVFTTRGTMGSDPSYIYDAVSGQVQDILPGAKRLTAAEFAKGAPSYDQEARPGRCANGSVASLRWQLVDNVREECACVLSSMGLVCDCANSFLDTRSCIDDTCGFDFLFLLNETCFWSPQLDVSLGVTGFSHKEEEFIWTSGDVRTWPLVFTISPNVSLELSGYESSEEEAGVFRPVFDFTSAPASAWTVSLGGNSTIQTSWLEYFGGVAVLGELSSSPASKGNPLVTQNTNTSTWATAEHDAFIAYTYPKDVVFTFVYLDLATVGLKAAFGGYVLPVEILVQVSETPLEHDGWITVATHVDSVINGSSRVSLQIPTESFNYRAIRVFSYFPMEIRTFVPFVDQNCTHGRLEGSRPAFQGVVASLALHPPSSDPSCICNDDCVLDGIFQGKDGECVDQILLGNFSEACPPGTDCSDCGSNLRITAADKTATCLPSDPWLRLLVEQFVNESIAAVDSVWTLYEYTVLGGASLWFNFTSNTTRARRWTRPECVLAQCPFVTCLDGSCAQNIDHCPSPLYNCPGNGCVRAGLLSPIFVCACKQGTGGEACNLDVAVAGDPETGLIDPNKWATCGGSSPLRIHPSHGELVFRGDQTALTTAMVSKINRPGGRVSADDVGWVNIRAEKAPFGIRFLRLVTRGNTTIKTHCPFRVKTNEGHFLELEECVARRRRAPPHEVQEWKTLPDGQVIVWHTETEYDDAPYPCPTGHCVARERDCYTMALAEPVCGGIGGKCLVDGTCLCAPGKQTFVLTQELTDTIKVPYKSIWGEENDNRFVSATCNARDCSKVDCGPPKGCFPGTPSLSFADRWIRCPAPYNTDKCARDIHGCKSGDELRDPEICSGNGVLKQRDYRPEELFCDCGHFVDGVFRSNGFGADNCGDYSCQDKASRIWWAKISPSTFETFKDINGQNLPGKWLGPCGATVGADPDDAQLWSTCCPGLTRLEKCRYVPCTFAGKTECTLIEDCMGYGHKPLVYVCNNHGRALADGTCVCDQDENSGAGYMYDLEVYSGKGCYGTLQCPVSRVSGSVCNAMPACSSLQYWTGFPYEPYFEQQIAEFVFGEGLSYTNRSILERMAGTRLQKLILDAYSQLALDLQSHLDGIASGVCVYPLDNCTAPHGMLPCDDIPGNYELVFNKALKSPYSLRSYVNSTVYPLLDTEFASTRLNYAKSTNQSAWLLSDSVGVSFNQSFYVDVLRLHVYTIGGSVALAIKGDDGDDVCQTVLLTTEDYAWVDIFCMPQYRGVRMDLEYPGLYAAHCLNDEFSADCEAWTRNKCLEIPGGNYRSNESLVAYPRCGSAPCCVALYGQFDFTTNVTLEFSSQVGIDELQVFGHGKQVQPMPNGLKAEFQAATGQSECNDEIAFEAGQSGIGGNLHLFRPLDTTTPRTKAQAVAECQDHGAELATNLGVVPVSTYAFALGAACYAGRDATGRGCHVQGKDRNEIRYPANISHLIRPSCTRYGCWTAFSSTKVYTADPGSGSQWEDAWIPNQVPWTTWFADISDRYVSEFTGTFKKQRWTLKTPNNWPTPPPGTTDFSAYFKDDGFTGLTYNHYSTQFELFVQPPLSPVDTANRVANEEFEIWTNNKQCLIEFYNVPNCGQWKDDPEVGKGARFRLYVTPKNYANMFGIDVLNLVHYIYPPGSCINQNQATSCRREGETLADSVSFLVQGPCHLRMTTSPTNTNLQDSLEDLPPNPDIGTGAYFFNPEKDAHIRGAGTDITDFWEGCYPQVSSTNAAVTDLIPGWGKTKREITRVEIIPQFSSTQVYVTVKTEKADNNPGTDEFNMGYNNHRYMCAVVSARTGLVVTSGETRLKLNPTTILDNVPVVPNYTSPGNPGNSAFFFLASGCVPTYANPCPVSYNFQLCDDNSPRPVVNCASCPVNTQGDYQFSQEFYNGDTFVTQVDAINQESIDHGEITYPPLNVTWTRVIGGIIRTEALSPNMSSLRAYVRMSSSLTLADYFSGRFKAGYCLAVVANPDNVIVPYTFTPVFCADLLLPLCVRTTTKYTSESGTNCPPCGPSIRTQAVAPGTTVFDVYPDTDPSKNPFGFEVLESHNTGELHVLTADLERVDWDLVATRLVNVSKLFAFPEAVDKLLRGFSDRQGLVSKGQTANPETWVDLDFHRIFPHDCGPVINKQTGVATRRCAAAPQFCDPSAPQYPGTLMPLDQMPTALTAAQDPSPFNPHCASRIDVSAYHKYTDKGAPQPENTNQFVVAADSTGSVKLRSVSGNGTWMNTGRMSSVSLNAPLTLAGNIQTSISQGKFRLWLGSVSPTYGFPSIIEYVSNWTTIASGEDFAFNYTPSSPFLAAAGIDFYGLQVGSTVTLQDLLVSNEETLGRCATFSGVQYVDVSSSTESYAPYLHCSRTDAEATGPGERIGECGCGYSKAWGGKTCDHPATATKERGKQVCNGYGEDGGLALTRSLGISTVEEDGVFWDTDRYLCKCINPALMIDTIRRPASAFDFAFITRIDKDPNEATFKVTPPPPDIVAPFSFEEAVQVCNSDNAALSSWSTGDEAQQFAQLALAQPDVLPAHTDLGFDSSGELRWLKKDEAFGDGSDEAIGDPCEEEDLCAALNYNNLVFNYTGGFLVDGRDINTTVSDRVFIIQVENLKDLTVEMWIGGAAPYKVYANGIDECLLQGASATLNAWKCLVSGITHLDFYKQQLFTPARIREVRVFGSEDDGRPVGYF